MFCFITSLRAPAVADDWSRVCALFERTASSVFNQVEPDFKLIAVCHEKPILNNRFDERLEFIKVDLPVPKREHDAMVGDKARKLLVAMGRVRELRADHVMPIDADDLVSSHLVAHVRAHPGADGWFIERGWQYEYGRWWIETVDRFNLKCGTCNILAKQWFSFGGDPDREQRSDQSLVVDGHGQVVDAFAALGAYLRPIPFPAAVYTIRNRENTSRLQFWQGVRSNPLRRIAGRTKRAVLGTQVWLNRRPCGNAIRREFGLVTAGL